MADIAGTALLGIGGFTIGVLIGMALRATARIVMYVAGLYLASLVVLSSLGLIIVNWSGIASLISSFILNLSRIANADIIFSSGVFGVSMTMGMIYGAVKSTAVFEEKRPFRFYKRFD